MIELQWLILATLTYLPLLPSLSLTATTQRPCTTRTMYPSRKCQRSCVTDDDCVSTRKHCRCDGECGKSCVNPNNRCRRMNGETPNGKVRLMPYNKFGAVAEYGCDKGYRMKGSGIRVCQGDGKWSGHEPMCVSQEQLDPSECGPAPDIPTAEYTPRRESGRYSVGDSVTYTCRYGHKPSPNDITSAYCVTTDATRWVGPNMTCILAGCAHLPPLRHGSIHYSSSILTYGSTATYDCTYGYREVGGPTRTCDETGAWSTPEPYCEPVRCGAPPNVTHSHITDDRGNDMTRRLTYTCLPGYNVQLRDHDDQPYNPYSTCSERGAWIGPVIKCQPISCSPPETIPHATIDGNEYTYPSTITYKCIPGYIMVGGSDRTCNATGYWTGSRPRCKPVVCGPLARPHFGDVIGTDYRYKGVLTFECDHGWMNTGSGQRRCGEDGRWTGKVAKCVESRCGPVPVIYNGYTDGHSYTVGSVHFYRCNIFTTFEGFAMNTQCYDTGRWSNPAPTCWGQCQVKKLHNGTVLHERIGTWKNHNTVIRYRCDAGLSLTGETRATCVNGTWTSVPTCAPEPCRGPPPNIANGRRIFFREHHGDRVRYQCLAGHRLQGSPYVECNYGTWRPSPPRCAEIYCENPGTLENGTIYKRGTRGRFIFAEYILTIRHGVRIEYQCNEDHRLVGPAGATCVDAEWRPTVSPKCVRSSHLPLVRIWHDVRVFY